MSRSAFLAVGREDASASSARRHSVRFALGYAIWASVLFFVYFVFAFPFSGAPYRIFTTYLHLYAAAAGALLRVFDPSIAVTAGNISGRASLAIVRGCDATEVLILFTAAVLASDSHPWRLRAQGAAFGAAAIVASNVARICCLYLFAVRAPEYLETWHTEVWPLLLLGVAIGLFLAWSRWATVQSRTGSS